jgi:hypothetical protein
VDYLILKRVAETGNPSDDWQVVAIILGAKDEEAAAQQAYSGEGSYKVLEWKDDIEAVVSPGAPEVTMVSKREVAEAAEAEAEQVRGGK